MPIFLWLSRPSPFAFDPMITRTSGRKNLTLQVINEPLEPGPIGYRLHVIDYDGASKKLYEPVDLDHPAVLRRIPDRTFPGRRCSVASRTTSSRTR